MERKGKEIEENRNFSVLWHYYIRWTYHVNNFCGGSSDAIVTNTSQSLQFNNQVFLVQHSSVAEYYTHAECNQSSKINRMTISRCWRMEATTWRMQSMTWLVSEECRLWLGSCLENAGCDFAPVWRMQAVTWLLSGKCRLWLGCCLENAGCDLTPV